MTISHIDCSKCLSCLPCQYLFYVIICIVVGDFIMEVG